MTPLPRGQCPACHGDIALRSNGTLRQHPDHRHDMYSVPGAVADGTVPVCPASGYRPDEWKEHESEDAR